VMRISEQEKKAFCDVIEKHITPPAELRLFGSRIDDTAKGGDIDLLLIVKDEQTRSKVLLNKTEILSDIKSMIGDQKIDLIITTQQAIPSSAFLTSIYPDSLLIKRF